MKRLALSLLVLVALAGGSRSEDEPSIDWVSDLATAREQAKKEGKPLFVVFR